MTGAAASGSERGPLKGDDGKSQHTVQELTVQLPACAILAHPHKDLIKAPVEVPLHSDRCRVSVGVCYRGNGVLRSWRVKRAEGSGVVFQGESSVKIPPGKTHTCHSVFEQVYGPALAPRCTGEIDVPLSEDNVPYDCLSGWLLRAHQPPQWWSRCICSPGNTAAQRWNVLLFMFSSNCFLMFIRLYLYVNKHLEWLLVKDYFNTIRVIFHLNYLNSSPLYDLSTCLSFTYFLMFSLI